MADNGAVSLEPRHATTIHSLLGDEHPDTYPGIVDVCI